MSQTTPSHIIGQLDKLLREVRRLLVTIDVSLLLFRPQLVVKDSRLIGRLSLSVSNQVSTLDGVLEVRNEHFWTVGFGSLVCPSDIFVFSLFNHMRLRPFFTLTSNRFPPRIHLKHLADEHNEAIGVENFHNPFSI